MAMEGLSEAAHGGYGEWTTHGRSGRLKVDFWNDLTSSVFTPLTIEPNDSDIFEARLTKADIAGMAVSRIWSAGSSVQHSRRHVALAQGEPCYLLHLQIGGTSVNEQAGRSIVMRPGDLTIVDSSRPYSLVFGAHTRFVVCRVAAARLNQFIGGAEDLVSTLIDGSLPATRLLRQMLVGISRECQRTSSMEWAAQSDTVVLSMLTLAARSIAAETCIPPDSHHLLPRAIGIIDDRVCDPDLGIGMLASELGVSERYVQRVFGAQGTTPTEFIMRRRIGKAVELLKATDLRITDVAMETGFGDLTNFGRSFRRIMGSTPSQFRRNRFALQ
jgi:AraC-like DNA-binding protein